MDLTQLLRVSCPDAVLVLPGEPHPVITGVCLDSRQAQPGDLFVALPGRSGHGIFHVAEALAAGASAVLTDPAGQQAMGETEVPLAVVADPRRWVGALASTVYGHPAEALLTFGVTGTNGKTTTTWLIEHALRQAGHRTGVIGTMGSLVNGRSVPTARTTPEAPQLHALLALMREGGVSGVALEVSSHALAQGRVDGVVLDVAGFTHLGHDHLDFHGTTEEYYSAKARLFTPSHARLGVVVVDDDAGRQLAVDATIPVRTASAEPTAVGHRDADWHLADYRPRPGGGADLVVAGPGSLSLDLRTRLSGRFNAANALLAVAMLTAGGMDAQTAARGVAACPGVPGRLEPVTVGQSFRAVVDYAHTPDALTAVLTALRAETPGRLVVVVGCGGDRDREKRPAMGATAAALADVVVVTDDNPRTENPASIRAAVIEGTRSVPGGRRAEVVEVADRARAMARAIADAKAGDTVVVAGKGHEQGQEVESDVLPFDDRLVLAELLSASIGDQPAQGGLA